MNVSAYATFTGTPGARDFVYGATPLVVGDVVRVTGYGYGATLQECGKEGRVTTTFRTRAEVVFSDGTTRRIGGACLAKIVDTAA